MNHHKNKKQYICNIFIPFIKSNKKLYWLIKTLKSKFEICDLKNKKLSIMTQNIWTIFSNKCK